MKYVEAVILLLVLGGILTGVAEYAKTFDATLIQPEFRWLWDIVVYAFATGGGATIFTFLRNILGYGYNYFEKEGNLTYDSNQLWATWMRFEFYFLSFARGIEMLTLNTPYYPYAITISGAIATLVDIAYRSVSKIAVAIQAPRAK